MLFTWISGSGRLGLSLSRAVCSQVDLEEFRTYLKSHPKHLRPLSLEGLHAMVPPTAGSLLPLRALSQTSRS